MPDLEKAISTRLNAFAGLTALVADRIYPMKLPQRATYPAVVYQRISTFRVHTHGTPSSLANPRFQFSCWGKDEIDVANVATQVRFAMEGLHATVASVRIDAGLVENDFEDYDPEMLLHRRVVDVLFWHEEATS